MSRTIRIPSIIAAVSIQTIIHYFLHIGAPFFLAVICFGKDWKRAYLIMLGTILVDLDHLLANPVFQPDRCSIGYHPFHTFYAMGVYLVMLFFKKTWRIIAVGLLFHMFTDALDCLFMFDKCGTCHEGNALYELWKGL